MEGEGHDRGSEARRTGYQSVPVSLQNQILRFGKCEVEHALMQKLEALANEM